MVVFSIHPLSSTDLRDRGATQDSHSLSYEFYQVMVGDTRMSIHGWKQLAEWSIEHSCLSDEEKKEAKKIYKEDWEVFCQWVVDAYGGEAASLPTPK
jgi:adenosine deaminase CECR1